MSLPLLWWGGSVMMTKQSVTAVPTLTQATGRMLASTPKADVAGTVGAATAATLAQQHGAGPFGTIAAAVFGAMAGGKVGAGGKIGAGGKAAIAEDAAQAARTEAKAAGAMSDTAASLSRTTNHETGVTGLSKANRNIMETTDWRLAKSGEMEPARRIVVQVWTPQHTAQLKAKLDPTKETVFLSVPSTTRLNKLPDALAERLANELGGVNADVGKLYKVEAAEAMKDIPKMDRPFASRSYTVLDAEAVSSLKGKQVVLTEDVLTTGSSARQFALELRRQGVEVQTVAGLMGNARLDAPPQLVDKLQRTLRNAKMDVKGRELADILSAGEIESIIEHINKAGGAHERAQLTQRIQGLLDSRTGGSMEKHSR